MKKTLITLAAATIGLSSAGAQTIVNGDFEDLTGLTSIGSSGQIFRGPSPAGWTWTPGGAGGAVAGIDVLDYALGGSPTPNANSGTYYFEVATRGDFGVLSQDISGFTVGQQYELNFDWGNRFGGDPTTSSFDFTVSIDGESFSQSAVNGSQLGLFSQSILFTASSSNLTLSLDLLDQDTFSGGAFDNFTVTAVPEPSSALLLGLSALGFIGRRKR